MLETSPTTSSQPARPSIRRLVLPAAITIVLLWVLAGCGLGIYLPIPEHAQAGKTDFRGLVGDAKSSRPIRPMTITRAGVVKILGAPDYQEDGGKTIGYVLRTYAGYYFAPLCFQGTGSGKWYRLRLTFGAGDVLTDYSVESNQ
jgi:hypothetical protein